MRDFVPEEERGALRGFGPSGNEGDKLDSEENAQFMTNAMHDGSTKESLIDVEYPSTE